MTLRLKLSLLISGVFGLLLSLFVTVAHRAALGQAERHTRELLRAACKRIEVGVRDSHLPLRQLMHEEEGISPQPISLLLFQHQRRVALIGHEPPADGAGWQLAELEFPDGRLVLGFPMYQTRAALEQQLYYLAGLASLAWLGLSVASYWLVGQVLRPIHALTQQARGLRGEPLQSPSTDVEVAELVETLNELLIQREQSTRQREQFYVAVSHELRTPLQALSGHLELALLRPRAPEEYVTFLTECQRQTARLKGLHEAILRLSQVDHGRLQREEEDYDLAEVLAEFLPETATARIEPTPTRAPRRLVELLVRNLMENAERHGDPEEPAQVELRSGWLSVRNRRCDGEPLDLEKLSQPFYRPEGSRQRGGNGLGLALVRAIAQRLGWELRLQCDPQEFAVQLALREL